MTSVSELSQSEEYLSFRSSVPLRRIIVDNDKRNEVSGWKIYDCGPKEVKCPLICLPSVAGTADIFYKQALTLSAKGVRVISAEAPIYWNVKEWCEGFKKLLDYLNISKAHLFGVSLGGYLAQKFAEYTCKCPRVASLILCNTFSDTAVFNTHEIAAIYWILPALVLRKLIIGNFETAKVDLETVQAIDFMLEKVESTPQSELASRLTLNATKGYVEAHKLADLTVTIIDVFDDYALSNTVREELYKCYPSAKLAHLKSGGNFPYLSRSAEVNLHLQIHLRQFDGTSCAASDQPLLNRI